jgi:hypothetical protein
MTRLKKYIDFMNIKSTLYLLLILVVPVLSLAQTQSVQLSLDWNPIQEIQVTETEFQSRLNFADASYDEGNFSTPYFEKKIPLGNMADKIDAFIQNAKFQALSNEELLLLENILSIPEEILVRSKIAVSRNEAFAMVRFLPFRLNPETAKYEKLISGELVVQTSNSSTKSGQGVNTWADNSVLASGNWYKIRVAEDGIYKVTYSNLADMGVNVSSLGSANIRLYGNGGGMLPEPNDEFRYDDLQENAIEVFDGGDGVFNQGDYFIFYGQSPDQWELKESNGWFYHQKNAYSDFTYYYITTDLGPGKRVVTFETIGGTLTPNYTVNQFTDYAFHEKDELNLIKSGREWYGEVFDFTKNYSFDFNFPNLNAGAEHFLRVKVAAKSTASSSFFASVDNQSVLTMLVSGVTGQYDYANTVAAEKKFSASGDAVTVDVQYNKSTSTSIGWLDYIEVNAIRNMTFAGSRMIFRDPHSVREDYISEFILTNAPSQNVKIWEVTNPTNVTQIATTANGNTQRFVLPTPVLREFVAFDGSEYLSVEFVETVPNQDIHGAGAIDYTIVSHPDFLDQANRLADFHRSFSNLNVLVATPQMVYNEFSSGAQDITAIKDMMRMFYERAGEGNKPKYMLLFGDASYDYKDIKVENTNFVPTFESVESLHQIYSYATDDYFGFLDPSEGNGASELLDIGIGRFIVRTPDEAQMAVDKVLHYATSPLSLGDWRNMITFVADDENGNTHMNQAEQLADFLDTTYRSYNIDKIYLDSYQQISTPGGQRYPDVNEAINTRMEKGTAIMNYTGHGGEVGWAHERVLEISDINSWTNYDKLSVFVTATCEFTRYDDPDRISAGEYVFLNGDGGAISLFTTARATFGGSNLSLNKGFYKYAFEKVDGEHYAMGDLIRLAKLESTSQENDKKFVLIGDPALKIAYPENNIETLFINQKSVIETPDTLKALSHITIAGQVVDETGNLVNSFNGALSAIVFDKESEVTTLGQDPGSYESTFKLRKNVIYKGKAKVDKGNFSFSFVVPKDIAYQYGIGKVSYYAENGETDASGYYEAIVVGGSSNAGMVDEVGPRIELFMNDTLFKSGGITNENPILIAKVFDETGINTVGNSIGHDIVAILDNDDDYPFILNDFYESELDSYKQGTVNYPFFNIPEGKHTIKFKVWDVYNNSSEAYIDFVVVDSESIVISDLINYPNPFSTETYFRFNYNQPDEQVQVEIEVFDLAGRRVAVMDGNLTSGGYYATPIPWDGTNATGGRLEGGLYIYKAKITSENGKQAMAVEKLLIAR